MPSKKKKPQIAAYTHPADTRRNIPTAEVEPVMDRDKRKPITLEYERAPRNTDLDPQLVWRGKDQQDQGDLVVTAPPIFIQEKVHPRVLIDDLMRHSSKERSSGIEQLNLFADFNGLENPDLKSEYYEHDQKWSNRMILGDGLQVMASLASREGLQGRVQCIYIDPPYGLGFNSNFQWSTKTRTVQDGNAAHITREPEQVKAFRDTWRDGIHSYLTYLRDRLTVARDLLTDTGSIFVQIGEENVHRVRALMDEVFGRNNYVNMIPFMKTAGLESQFLPNVNDYIVWFAKDREQAKFRKPYALKQIGREGTTQYTWIESPMEDVRSLSSSELAAAALGNRLEGNLFSHQSVYTAGSTRTTLFDFEFQGRTFHLPTGQRWRTPPEGMRRLERAGRLFVIGNSLRYKRFFNDFLAVPIQDVWRDTSVSGFSDGRAFVVQTNPKVISRCITMVTDPGDLVLDPTCGGGTTAHVAEQWGRRWITIDTSRVALALARARIMASRYPYYLLADSQEGRKKEAEVSHKKALDDATYESLRQGFVYERVAHVTLRDIANNTELDVIYDKLQEKVELLREELNAALGSEWQEWEVPTTPDESWTTEVHTLHQKWWDLRIFRRKEIDASIAGQATFEFLYDKPYEDRNKIRVAGPFTVESLSPHRLLVSGDVDEPKATPVDTLSTNGHQYEGTAPERDFASMIIENLRTTGVQQPNKNDKIEFNSIEGWPGEYICAEAEYTEGESGKRAGIFIGPEFGTVGQPDLTAAAREAGQAGFDVLISCAFSYDAHATEFNRLGSLPVLKARMNADLHMDTDLKNTGQGNLFVIFGEPDITLEELENEELQVKIKG